MTLGSSYSSLPFVGSGTHQDTRPYQGQHGELPWYYRNMANQRMSNMTSGYAHNPGWSGLQAHDGVPATRMEPPPPAPNTNAGTSVPYYNPMPDAYVPAQSLNISDKGWRALAKHEAFRSKPYRCPSDIPTIGYGSTYYPNGRRVTLQDPPITEPQAEYIARAAIAKDFEAAIDRYVRVKLTQYQFDALVMLIYNIGVGNFLNSSVLRKLNQGDYQGAADAFLPWNKRRVRGVLTYTEGLARRRKHERAIFLGQPVY